MNWSDIIPYLVIIAIFIGVPIAIVRIVRFLFKKLQNRKQDRYPVDHTMHHRNLTSRTFDSAEFENNKSEQIAWTPTFISTTLTILYLFFVFNLYYYRFEAPIGKHPPLTPINADSPTSHKQYHSHADTFANIPPTTGVHPQLGGRKPVNKPDNTYKKEQERRAAVLNAMKKDVFRIKSDMAHDIPKQMEVGVLTSAMLRIARTQDESVLLRGVPASEKSHYALHTIAITTRVTATLTDPAGGKNFAIDRGGSTAEQVVGDGEATIWQWNITPLQSGDDKVLDLTIKTMVKDGFGTGYTDIPVYTEHIHVKTNTIYTIKMFFINGWQYIVGTFCIPLFIWGWKSLKDRRAAKKNKHQPVKGFLQKDS